MRVFLTQDADSDLDDIHEYILRSDGESRAEAFLEKVEGVLNALAEYPGRGPHPPELLALGIRDFRETRFKPYRIIYQIVGDMVQILLIADGRRDMLSLLQRRLLS